MKSGTFLLFLWSGGSAKERISVLRSVDRTALPESSVWFWSGAGLAKGAGGSLSFAPPRPRRKSRWSARGRRKLGAPNFFAAEQDQLMATDRCLGDGPISTIAAIGCWHPEVTQVSPGARVAARGAKRSTRIAQKHAVQGDLKRLVP